MQSNEDAIKLMVNMRGLKIGNSNLGLTFYWPVEMQHCGRLRLNNLVEKQRRQLHIDSEGCFYDIAIENKLVLIFTISSSIFYV